MATTTISSLVRANHELRLIISKKEDTATQDRLATERLMMHEMRSKKDPVDPVRAQLLSATSRCAALSLICSNLQEDIDALLESRRTRSSVAEV